MLHDLTTTATEFIKFYKQEIVDALSIAFGLVGVVAYIDQRRTNKSQEIFIKVLQRGLVKDVSEEEIKKLSDEKLQLQKQTAEDIPKLARRALLQQQASVLATSLAETYAEWQAIQKEIPQLESSISQALTQQLTDRLLPQYMARMKKDYLRDRIWILAIVLIVCGILIPYPLDRVLQIALSAYLGSAIIEYLSYRPYTDEFKKSIHNFTRALFAIVTLWLIGFGVIVLFMDTRNVTRLGVIAGYASISLSGIFIILFVIFDKRFGTWLEQRLRAVPLS